MAAAAAAAFSSSTAAAAAAAAAVRSDSSLRPRDALPFDASASTHVFELVSRYPQVRRSAQCTDKRQQLWTGGSALQCSPLTTAAALICARLTGESHQQIS